MQRFLFLAFCLLIVSSHGIEAADFGAGVRIEQLDPNATNTFLLAAGEATYSGRVQVIYENGTLVADRLTYNQVTHQITADGNVRIEREGALWVGEHVQYQFETRQMAAAKFRAGYSSLFVAGEGLDSDLNAKKYSARNATITSDDYAEPGYHIRAKKITLVPGEYVKAEQATVKVGSLPVFYMPVWIRSLRPHKHFWVETPGYRSRYGPFLLSGYHYRLSEQVTGILDLDYRQKRGFGYGPGLQYDLGRWGAGEGGYYRTHDEDPGLDPARRPIPDERQRGWFEHMGQPATNLTFRAALKYQSDPQVIRDFYEFEYRNNVQPATFAEIQKSWPNWSLNVMAQGRVNEFFETVERLPDVKLTGLRQQIGSTPLFYESESSAGYFRRRFGDDVQPAYGAFRADSLHQIFLPKTLFNWLNVTPRVGSRVTHYGEVDGFNSVLNERDRYVFNTGAELSTKASRVWKNAENQFFDIHGVRHIVEPSLNYAFVPSPSRAPRELAQFDYEIPSRRLLPIDYPDYNAIDSVDSENVVRMGLRNRLQTQRKGQVEDVVSWAVYSDWRLHPKAGQGTYSDLYSDLDLLPFSWLALSSELRYGLDDGDWKEINHLLTLRPNNVWSFSLGHRYFRDDPLLGPDSGHNLISSRFYYRLSENWGFRSTQHFEARDGKMEEQMYSFYRDFRSWTGVFSFRVREGRNNEPTDYAVTVIFNFKVRPRYKSGADVNRHDALLTP